MRLLVCGGCLCAEVLSVFGAAAPAQAARLKEVGGCPAFPPPTQSYNLSLFCPASFVLCTILGADPPGWGTGVGFNVL